MTRIRRGYVEVQDGQVHYAMSGDAGARPIVLFHQTASSSAMFEPMMQRLAPRRCVALDSPGFGGSTPGAVVSIEAWAETLDGALEALGIEHMDVVGHHTGAAVALAVARRRLQSVCSLTLGGPPLLSEKTRDRIRRRATRVSRVEADGTHLLDAWRLATSYAPRGPLELVQRETLLYLSADAPHLAMLAVLDYDFAQAVATIECPLLLLAGDADPIIEGIGAVAALRPSATVAVIPDAGVHVFDEQPDAVAATLVAFLDDAEVGGHRCQ